MPESRATTVSHVEGGSRAPAPIFLTEGCFRSKARTNIPLEVCTVNRLKGSDRISSEFIQPLDRSKRGILACLSYIIPLEFEIALSPADVLDNIKVIISKEAQGEISILEPPANFLFITKTPTPSHLSTFPRPGTGDKKIYGKRKPVRI